LTLWQLVLLGIIQGASEFLPISSSGHLVIFQKLLNVNAKSIYLEVALHFGTLLAVVIYFWRDLVNIVRGTVAYAVGNDRRTNKEAFVLFFCLFVGSIPAAVGGLLLEHFFESTFNSTNVVGVMLLVTAAILLSTAFVKAREGKVNYLKALIIGVAQFAAILPGISRSGTTISAGLFMRVNPSRAARFSFLLSVPAVTGAFLLKLKDVLEHPLPGQELIDFGAGAIAAFVVGLLAIHYLLKIVARRRFYIFGFWCLLIGLVTLIFV
jgi:undecaprenyl-diphosphatase